MPSLPFRVDMAVVLAPTRTRRVLIGIGIIIFLGLYFRSLSFKTEPDTAPISTRVSNFPSCLSGYRAQFERLSADMDIVLNVGPKRPDRLFLVGNGHVATTPLTGAHSVLLDNAQPLDLGHNINLKFYIHDSAFTLAMSVLHLKNGQVDLYHVGESCITIKETIFTSLATTSVIGHDVTINNPTKTKQTVTVKTGIDTHLEDIQNIKVSGKTGVVYSDLVHSINGEAYVAAAASVLSHKTIDIEAYKDGNVKLFVSLASSKLPDVGERSEKLKDVCKIVKEQLINLDQNKVVLDHVANWKDIRKSGLRLQPLQDHLMAKPLEVNLTMYYLMSMYKPPTVIPESSTTNCFKGSPSSHSPVLWTQVKSLDAAYARLSSWKTVLATGGCSEFSTSSRLMFYQALLRSFTGLIETIHGLELALNPHSMEGYITLWGIEFQEILINISVAVNTPSHTGYVKIWKNPEFNETPLYACDQICASDIATVPSNGKEITFSIHPTNPATPIVYIATQQEQLITLRQLIEEHHGLDLHSLEEHPISALFIIVISMVIVVFHALLFHMIYKEFCSGDRGLNKSAR